ncbi:ankyrin repeat, SAM and basic leucine zipper domain-containing protein 1 isoform X2 [Danaus plexippus]|uniref:ankyrin repeat, SAM and basic leucine zipper domain-containing protein 1 isoform X2 n=1 Tax=Danaus plexippus TaxID=13037 RepID=UPI002AB136A9|nr:ankyrin repeat, SAM and basic leucine zipper domain-containing protein 1 isoform X2 [Danaus plexippus]
MANFRPAGFSDDDSDSDGYYDKMVVHKNYLKYLENNRKNIEEELKKAITKGDIDGVSKIINSELKGNVNGKLQTGWTPLLHACFLANEKVVQYLLEKGADPNIHADSMTPVMMACLNSTSNEAAAYNIVSNLIQSNCMLNIGDKYGVTPLMKAVISGKQSIVELLVDTNVNIEMRDRQGWTAVFWAIHHNRPKALDLLLKKGARLNIVDISNRTPAKIAYSHDYLHIHSVISAYEKTCEDDDETIEEKEISRQKGFLSKLSSWHDFYPGLRDESKPKFAHEISNLLYGMNCDRLRGVFDKIKINLRDFLLMEEKEMIKYGVDLPFERQRLKQGIRGFHLRSWKVNSVAGLQTRRGDPYSIVECLSILGSHLEQLYILESTLTYVLRDFNRIQSRLKFEAPDSPVMVRLQQAASKMICNINSIRREANAMKKIHVKISKDSLRPVDLITEKTTKDVAVELITELVVLSCIGLLVYNARSLVTKIIVK